jgi:hypothetical protein
MLWKKEEATQFDKLSHGHQEVFRNKGSEMVTKRLKYIGKF